MRVDRISVACVVVVVTVGTVVGRSAPRGVPILVWIVSVRVSFFLHRLSRRTTGRPVIVLLAASVPTNRTDSPTSPV